MALKLATGAGKTTVMAMMIAWQTLNAVRHPSAKRFTKGFLVVAPGITIKDRLRVLQPNDPESYYKSREIVPEDMLLDLGKAKIVITNYHAFKKKDEVPLNKVQQAALRTTPKPESDGAMIRRVAGGLMGLKNVVVINDEAHHCYRERPLSEEEQKALKGDELAEAKEANEAARLWISGIEAVKRELGVSSSSRRSRAASCCVQRFIAPRSAEHAGSRPEARSRHRRGGSSVLQRFRTRPQPPQSSRSPATRPFRP